MQAETMTPPPAIPMVETPNQMVTFKDLVPLANLKQAIDRLGFDTPTPVQSMTLPLAFSGFDVVVQAKTGSGKTLAFALPLLAALEKGAALWSLKNNSTEREAECKQITMALVLTPTRELANQICEVIRSIDPQVSPVCLIGGVSIKEQLRELHNDRRVIVGTPGRVLDLLRQREISLREAQFFAVDEVDEMFSMDFSEDVENILGRIPEGRQGIFVSATVTPRVEMLAKKFLHAPRKVAVESSGEDLPLIDHQFCPVGAELTAKVTALCDFIEVVNPRSAIIFCNTKSDTELVEVYLRRRGFDARLLNSDLNQKQRDAIVALIRAEKLHLLIGTDIAARGLDIDHIDLVVNYSLPDQHEVYIHRSGRTGRAGRAGRALTLLAPRDLLDFSELRKKLPLEFTEVGFPSDSEVLDARVKHVRNIVDAVSGPITAKELAVAQRLVEEIGEVRGCGEELLQLVAKLSRVLLEHEAMKVNQEAALEGVQLARVSREEPSASPSHSRNRNGNGRGGRDRRPRRSR